ncbi:MAG: RecX family transcriptional regulator [Candidatus Sumerlaeaceae bacterium]|nr:RecX family transcriptional regulator [Candidatus Sumerlaeaceae bacterium]
MRVLSLKYGKSRAGGHFEVQFDDDTILTLDAELVVRFQLKVGFDVSANLRAEMEAEQERLTARRRMVRYLALRRKTRREALHYLERLGFSEAAIEYAMAAAAELKLVDDERFAESFQRTQQRVGKKGPRAISHELRMRGVDKELASKTVAESAKPENQRSAALIAGEKKAKALKSEEPRKARQKLQMFLMRKGYDGDIVAEVTRKLLGENDD